MDVRVATDLQIARLTWAFWFAWTMPEEGYVRGLSDGWAHLLVPQMWCNTSEEGNVRGNSDRCSWRNWCANRSSDLSGLDFISEGWRQSSAFLSAFSLSLSLSLFLSLSLSLYLSFSSVQVWGQSGLPDEPSKALSRVYLSIYLYTPYFAGPLRRDKHIAIKNRNDLWSKLFVCEVFVQFGVVCHSETRDIFLFLFRPGRSRSKIIRQYTCIRHFHLLIKIIFPPATPKSVDFPSEFGSERTILSKETWCSLVRGLKSWRLQWKLLFVRPGSLW